MRQNGKLGRIDHSIGLVHERQIDTRDKLHGRWAVGVRLATSDLEAVDSVLVYSLFGIGIVWNRDQ